MDKVHAGQVLEEYLGPLETLLRSLLHGEYSSLTLSFNDEHACNYMSAAAWNDDSGDEQRFDFVSDEEREKALRDNSVWTLQWYPNTPVSFCMKSASSIGPLLRWVVENVDG